MKFTVGSNNDDDDEDDDNDNDDNDSNENSTTKHWLIMSENKRRSARVSCILVHVFAVLCKAIRWHHQI